MKFILYTILFMASLAMLYSFDKDLFKRYKLALLFGFIAINGVFMVGLSFSDDPSFGVIYNTLISTLLVAPSLIGFIRNKK